MGIFSFSLFLCSSCTITLIVSTVKRWVLIFLWKNCEVPYFPDFTGFTPFFWISIGYSALAILLSIPFFFDTITGFHHHMDIGASRDILHYFYPTSQIRRSGTCHMYFFLLCGRLIKANGNIIFYLYPVPTQSHLKWPAQGFTKTNRHCFYCLNKPYCSWNQVKS